MMNTVLSASRRRSRLRQLRAADSLKHPPLRTSNRFAQAESLQICPLAKKRIACGECVRYLNKEEPARLLMRNLRKTASAALLLLCLGSQGLAAHTAVRARDLRIPFQGTPGALNAITDVNGVEVGERTVISGSGPLVRGHGPVRTGVTIIHPLGKNAHEAVAAAFAIINGTGEWTGMRMVEELGFFFGPIALTGTGNIGIVHQAMVDWSARPGFATADELIMRSLPLVGETLDDPLNDVFGHALQESDVLVALDEAHGGIVAEGNVGGGTGMIAYGFKGGTGTASRVVSSGGRIYTVGVLLQSNHGRRGDLRVAGVPVGEEITDLLPELGDARAPQANTAPAGRQGKNSILVVIATDAPLQAHQLSRLARRAALGLGRNGGTANDLSGEFALAFSTGYRVPLEGAPRAAFLVNDNDEHLMNALFAATVQAVEEAEINQLVASETMVGANGAKVYALPHDRLTRILRAHNRLAGSGVH
jgi:L-aminopeptidase/D-esterase-like protein